MNNLENQTNESAPQLNPLIRARIEQKLGELRTALQEENWEQVMTVGRELLKNDPDNMEAKQALLDAEIQKANEDLLNDAINAYATGQFGVCAELCAQVMDNVGEDFAVSAPEFNGMCSELRQMALNKVSALKKKRLTTLIIAGVGVLAVGLAVTGFILWTNQQHRKAYLSILAQAEQLVKEEKWQEALNVVDTAQQSKWRDLSAAQELRKRIETVLNYLKARRAYEAKLGNTDIAILKQYGGEPWIEIAKLVEQAQSLERDNPVEGAKAYQSATSKLPPVIESAVAAKKKADQESAVKAAQESYNTALKKAQELEQAKQGKEAIEAAKEAVAAAESIDPNLDKSLAMALLERLQEANRQPGETMTVTLRGNVKMEFVWLPPAKFIMGSPPSEPGREGDEIQHWVQFAKGVWIGKYEVTQAQWESVMESNPSPTQGTNLPVQNVSWDDCQVFIQRLNAQFAAASSSTSAMTGSIQFRLPTEAEWEYACRAGTRTPFYSGATAGDLAQAAWYAGNSENKIHPVGEKTPNAFGLYDTHGNVWEWCQDWYDKYPVTNQRTDIALDPTGAVSGKHRVLRGGAYNDPTISYRAANRGWNVPAIQLPNNGLRLCAIKSR